MVDSDRMRTVIVTHAPRAGRTSIPNVVELTRGTISFVVLDKNGDRYTFPWRNTVKLEEIWQPTLSSEN